MRRRRRRRRQPVLPLMPTRTWLPPMSSSPPAAAIQRAPCAVARPPEPWRSLSLLLKLLPLLLLETAALDSSRVSEHAWPRVRSVSRQPRPRPQPVRPLPPAAAHTPSCAALGSRICPAVRHSSAPCARAACARIRQASGQISASGARGAEPPKSAARTCSAAPRHRSPRSASGLSSWHSAHLQRH